METLGIESENLLPDYLTCPYCGCDMERGLINVQRHYDQCLERKINYVSFDEESIKKAQLEFIKLFKSK